MFEPALKSKDLKFGHELTKDKLVALPQQLSIFFALIFMAVVKQFNSCKTPVETLWFIIHLQF